MAVDAHSDGDGESLSAQRPGGRQAEHLSGKNLKRARPHADSDPREATARPGAGGERRSTVHDADEEG